MRRFLVYFVYSILHFPIFLTPVSAKEILPLSALGKLPEVSMVRISPSGEYISYRLKQKQTDLLVVKHFATDNIVGKLSLEGVTPTDLYFVSDDEVIIRAQEYRAIRGYKGKHDVSSAFVFNIKKNRFRQLLIPGYGIYKGQTSLGDIVGLSPDGKQAYMPAYVGEQQVNGSPPMALTRVLLSKKRQPRIVNRGTLDAIDYFIDHNAQLIARERYDNAKDLHIVQSYIDGKWFNIFEEVTPVRNKAFVGVTPDRQSLVMLAESDNNSSAYYTVSLLDGTVSKPLFAKQNIDIESVLTDVQRVVYGVKYAGFKPRYAFFNQKLEAQFNAIQLALPNNSFHIVDFTSDWQKIVVYIEGQDSPGDYLIFANNEFSHVASARPEITVESINPVEISEFKAQDGLTIPTLVTLPVDRRDTKPLAAIVLPHGGPESHDKFGFDWLAQYFASRGYAVIQPQFRGSTGFGTEHVIEGRGQWGQKMQQDLIDSITHFADLNIIDKNRVCIVGASYGGYAALAGITFTPDVYQCAISINGVSDIGKMLKKESANYGRDHWVVAYWQEVINTEASDDQFIRRISPINFVQHVKKPVLIIHGKNDTVVPYEQSNKMYKALKLAGKQVKLVSLDNEGHYLSNNQTRMQTLEAIDTFMNAIFR